jgi:hypothetical protein
VYFIRLGVASACRLILLLHALDITGVFCLETKSLVSKDFRYGLCQVCPPPAWLGRKMESLRLAGASNERDFHFASDDRMTEKVTVMSGGVNHRIKVESKLL